jgi:negative regulator of sigma E activity
MADKENTEVPPASQSPAPVTTAAPVAVVRERGSWVTPLVAALVVVAALVLGGVSGFALAAATHAGDRPAIQQGQLPGQQGPLQGPGQQGERPDRPSDDSTEQDSDETTEQDSTEG